MIVVAKKETIEESCRGTKTFADHSLSAKSVSSYTFCSGYGERLGGAEKEGEVETEDEDDEGLADIFNGIFCDEEEEEKGGAIGAVLSFEEVCCILGAVENGWKGGGEASDGSASKRQKGCDGCG